MSGIPYWTCDIGAFLVSHRYPDALSDPAYRELYVRWFQFGAMLPIFRAHGSQIPRHVWAFGEAGEPVYDALTAMLRLRYALLPYIYSTAAAVTHDGDTMLRGLMMDFPDDPDARDRPQQFMFGRSLLVRVVDRPLLHSSVIRHELLPPDAVRGAAAPAAEVSYFEGADFDRLVSRRLTDDLKMSWFGDLPRELAGKPYSVRWQGRIVAPETGTYTLAVTGTGATRLVFDGAVLIDRAAPDGGRMLEQGPFGADDVSDHASTVDVRLDAGHGYDFVLEQRQSTPDVIGIWLEWITPGQRVLAEPPDRPVVDVYLPRGSEWFDVATGERFPGGVTLQVEAPLDHLPRYARAGSVIPMTPGVTRAGAPVESLDIQVFAGADGSFALYEDEGDGHAYQQGAFATVPMRWSQAEQTLTIGPRAGDYPGRVAALPITARLVDGISTRDDDTVGGPATASGVFDGTPLVLSLRR
jgi:alpha-D-xyloside xylohydrolase